MSDLIREHKPLGLFGRPIAPTKQTAPARPRDPGELCRFVRDYFGVGVPSVRLCPGHQSPLDYLCGSFFDQSDMIVWANRGGGKTLMAAVATLLDAIFRSPAKIRVLGGSFDQSDRLAEYIKMILEAQPNLVRGRMTRERVRLVGGSEIRMLAQSQRAVRGQHVQKIRCDEVDLFDGDVWQAVQFSTNSAGPTRGSIEVLSTLHRPGGLMEELVRRAQAGPAPVPPWQAGFRLVRWCLWEVIERCPPHRRCRQCLLAEDCAGRAREAGGFFPIDDAIAIKARSSRASWEAEMLCRGAARHDLVFQEFDPAVHVQPVEWVGEWPTYRAIDFGYRSPLVCLWIQVSPGGAVHVLEEYVRAQLPIARHAAEILRRDRTPVVMTYVDPAGRQREATSGSACTELLAAAGIPCTARASTIAEGLELIRAALAPAVGSPSLIVHPRCAKLIEAFRSYHYPPPSAGTDRENPVKDGPDHLLDALRYFFVNRMRPAGGTRRGTY